MAVYWRRRYFWGGGCVQFSQTAILEGLLSVLELQLLSFYPRQDSWAFFATLNSCTLAADILQTDFCYTPGQAQRFASGCSFWNGTLAEQAGMF